MNLESYTTFYNLSKTKINNFLHDMKWTPGTIITNFKEKKPQDLVTEYDLSITNIIQEALNELNIPFQLISEENFLSLNALDLNAPIVILDPIDGTKGFVEGTNFFSLSLSFVKNGKPISSWVWNFGNQEEEIIFPHDGPKIKCSNEISTNKSKLKGLISDTEYNKNLWPNLSYDSIVLEPCGSIAYKLLLLSQNKCDFVISKRPKNLWDIAGGSHLVMNKGLKFYEQNINIDLFNKMKFYSPLLWCREEDKNNILKTLDLL